jgi:hypothetical protein
MCGEELAEFALRGSFFFKKNQFPFTLVSWNAFVFVCVDISWSGLPVAECLSDAVSESYAALSY